MRVLCVCNGGHVRSVTLARLIRKRGHEALVCGVNSSYTNDTLKLLFNWAETILIQKDSAAKLEKRMQIDKDFGDAVRWITHGKFDLRYDVGPDDWKVPQHPDLLKQMRMMVDSIPLLEEVRV